VGCSLIPLLLLQALGRYDQSLPKEYDASAVVFKERRIWRDQRDSLNSPPCRLSNKGKVQCQMHRGL